MTCEQNDIESTIALYVGIIGCCFGFIANSMQVYHMYKKKHVEGISLWYIILLFGLAVMFSVYSIILNLIPVLLLNVPYGITNLIMLYYYFYGKMEMEIVNVNSSRIDYDDTRVIIAFDDDIKSLSLSGGI